MNEALKMAIAGGTTASDPCRKGGHVPETPTHVDCRIPSPDRYSGEGEKQHWTGTRRLDSMKIRSHVPRSHVPNRTRRDPVYRPINNGNGRRIVKAK